MRQAGVLAAAGLIALTTMADRLEEDHRVARHIAQGLRSVPGIVLDPDEVQTNMVYMKVTRSGLDAPGLSRLLRERGVLANASGPSRMRLVTHHQVSMTDADRALAAFRGILAGDRRELELTLH